MKKINLLTAVAVLALSATQIMAQSVDKNLSEEINTQLQNSVRQQTTSKTKIEAKYEALTKAYSNFLTAIQDTSLTDANIKQKMFPIINNFAKAVLALPAKTAMIYANMFLTSDYRFAYTNRERILMQSLCFDIDDYYRNQTDAEKRLNYYKTYFYHFIWLMGEEDDYKNWEPTDLDKQFLEYFNQTSQNEPSSAHYTARAELKLGLRKIDCNDEKHAPCQVKRLLKNVEFTLSALTEEEQSFRNLEQETWSFVCSNDRVTWAQLWNFASQCEDENVEEAKDNK